MCWKILGLALVIVVGGSAHASDLTCLSFRTFDDKYVVTAERTGTNSYSLSVNQGCGMGSCKHQLFSGNLKLIATLADDGCDYFMVDEDNAPNTKISFLRSGQNKIEKMNSKEVDMYHREIDCDRVSASMKLDLQNSCAEAAAAHK